MSRTRLTTLAGTAVATLTLSGLAITGASHAATDRAASTSHRLSFVSRTVASHRLGRNALIETDKALRNGSVIGYTANSCTFDFSAGSAQCLVTLARADGQLRTRVTVDNETGVVRGAVTGGSGAYSGATGTVAGRATSASSVAITLRWTD